MRAGLSAAALLLALASHVTPAAAERPPSSAVSWLFLIDDLHIDFRTTGIVRTWLRSLVKALIREDDVFAAVTTGPSSMSVGWLAGLADLDAGIRRVSGAALKPEEARRFPEGADELVYRARVSIKAATEFLATAPEHDSRRRVLVYVGKGFDIGDPLSDEIQSLLTEAWRLNATLIAVDPTVLPGSSATVPSLADAQRMRGIDARRRSLEAFALPTDGFVLADEASVRDAATRISSAVRSP
jgi:hypothetical protein